MTLAVDRDRLRGLLAGLDLTERPAEVVARQRMLDLLNREPRCFTPSEVRALPGDGGLHRLVDKWEAFRDERKFD